MKNRIILLFITLTINAQAQLNLKWSNIHSLSGGTYPSKVMKIACCIDCCLDIYVPGNESYEQTLDSIKGTIAKYDTSGALLWITPLSPAVSLSAFGTFHTGAGLTASAKSYVAGSPVVVAYNTSPTISRLIRVDTTGSFVMNVVVSGVDRIMDIETDSSGNIYAVGRTPQSTCFGFPCNGIAVAKYNSSGAQVWKKTKYTSGYKSEPVDLILDDDGNVIVCGKKTAASSGSQFYNKSFVVKYSNTGTQIWAKEYSSYSQIACCIDDVDSPMEGHFLRTDASGDVYFADTQVDTTTLIPTVKLRKKAALTGNVLFTKTITNAESRGTWILCCDDGDQNPFSVIATTTGMRAYNSTGQQKWSNNYIIKAGIICCDENGNTVVATNVNQTEPLSKFLLELDGNSGTVLYQKYLSFGNHQEYEGDYEAISKDPTGNVYLVINDTVPPYGTRVTKLSQCDNTSVVTGSLDITKISGNNCANGKIKVQSLANGTINNWIHIDLYNNSNALIGAVDVPAGTSNYTFQNLNSGKYTVKIYDESCGELVKSGTISCPTPSSGFSATNIQPTSATVNWNDVSCDDGYRVQYRKSGTNTWNYLYVGGNSAVLNNLLPATVYSWRVASKCINSTPLTYSSVVPQVHSFTTAALKNGNGMPDVIYGSLWIEISPNPVNDKMLLSTTENIKGAVIKIFNSQGQLVLEKKIKALNENEPEEIETAFLSKGVYLMKLTSETGVATQKFIKQ